MMEGRCWPRITSKYPNKHDTLTQYWVNIGPQYPTSAQHSPSIGSMYRVCWDSIYLVCAERAHGLNVKLLDFITDTTKIDILL